MRFRRSDVLALIALAAACGGQAPPAAEPMVASAPKGARQAKKSPRPAREACVRPGVEMSLIGRATANARAVRFCVSDGAETNKCYRIDLDSGELTRLHEPPQAQSIAVAGDQARVETTPTEVNVCKGTACQSFRPRVPKDAENPIDAHTNAAGTIAAVFLGDTDAGKGIVEVWDVAKGKKRAKIRYANGDHKCGTGQVIGDLVYISASVCSGPAATGAIYSARGRKLADVGGKQFGTYGTTAIQLDASTWAFLEENATRIALHDGKTGKLTKVLDVSAVWRAGAGDEAEAPAKGDDADDAPPPPPATASGNPGESALVRGGPGKLIVITGHPTPGNLAIVDVASGEVKVVPAADCKE